MTEFIVITNRKYIKYSCIFFTYITECIWSS